MQLPEVYSAVVKGPFTQVACRCHLYSKKHSALNDNKGRNIPDVKNSIADLLNVYKVLLTILLKLTLPHSYCEL